MAETGRLKLITSLSRQLPTARRHPPPLQQSRSWPDFEQEISGGFCRAGRLQAKRWRC